MNCIQLDNETKEQHEGRLNVQKGRKIENNNKEKDKSVLRTFGENLLRNSPGAITGFSIRLLLIKIERQFNMEELERQCLLLDLLIICLINKDEDRFK